MQFVDFGKIGLLDGNIDELYKRLRTNIQFCGDDIKVLEIVSSVPNEGKTTVSFNLAVSFAQSGKKVIFIDADLRNSVMLGRYRINGATKGLTHYLSGVCSFDQVVCATNMSNLHVVFSGPVPPNPAELLGNKYFKSLVKILRESYDYVIIDTPPVGRVIDAAVIAGECDGAAIVVSSGEVSYKLIQRIKNQIEKAGCQILGVILNKAPVGKGKYGKYNIFQFIFCQFFYHHLRI
jgi:capsular exopolysaccharide synthesis family protein